MIATITIVRHGNTFAPGEPPRRIGARTDLPLVESGRAQALALGEAFASAGVRFDRVFCAPLARTRETADLLLSAMPAPSAPEPADWLAEIDHGPDENQPENVVIARIGADALADWDRRGIAPPGWTVDMDARSAAWRSFYDAMRHSGGHALLVTSNGAARFALIADPVLAREAAAPTSLKLRTGAWGRILLDGATGRIETWDRRP